MVTAQGPLQKFSPVVNQAVHHDVSPPLFLIPPAPRQPGFRVHAIKPIPRRYQGAAVDPVLQQSYPTTLAPVTILNFDDVGIGFSGPSGTFTGANGTSVPFLQCVAVSQTADPTGAYNRYSFPYSNFNDYPKMGVWPDAYYTTFNMFSGNTFVGGQVCAYDRGAMLNALAATQQCFQLSSSFGGLLPSDLDGATAPPAGSPNYLLALPLAVTATTLEFWKFNFDWTTPGNTTLTGPTTITVATYTAACNGGTCIPQAGTSQTLDSLADRLMYRLAYRNFGSHESLVVNHSVSAGSGGGVRWYEI